MIFVFLAIVSIILLMLARSAPRTRGSAPTQQDIAAAMEHYRESKVCNGDHTATQGRCPAPTWEPDSDRPGEHRWDCIPARLRYEQSLRQGRS